MSDDEVKTVLDNAQVVFGLRNQGHMPTIKQMLLAGESWEAIGSAIGWEPNTAKRHWEREVIAWVTELEGMLDEAIGRMDRARGILTKDNPSPTYNWGMLDTASLKARRLAQRKDQP